MTILVSDTFTDTDATSLDAHTPDTRPGSNTWTEHLGNWRITSNKSDLAATTSNASASIDSGQADVNLTVKANSTTTTGNNSSHAGLAARVTDASNNWRIGVNNQLNEFAIIERNAATNTTRASAAQTVNSGTEYTITAQLSGASITAQVDGTNEISYGSATLNQTTTRHGVIMRNTGDTVDDFLVEVAGAATSTPPFQKHTIQIWRSR